MTAGKILFAMLGSAALLQLALLPASDAVSISNGERIYGSICFKCHSSGVTNNVYGILAGGNDPEFITRTFASKPPMQFLGSILSPADIEDVAAYLGADDGVDPDRIFDWAEWKYSVVLQPAGVLSEVAAGYYFRHYAQSSNYVAIRQGRVYYYETGMAAPLDVGAAVDFLGQAAVDDF